jgi:hypothetical protein
MRLYIICPLLLVLGCAATEPQASIKLKNPDCKGIIMVQTTGDTFEGSAEMLFRSNVSGISIYTKIIDAGVITMKQDGGWKLSLSPCGEKPVHQDDSASLTINTIHRKGHEKCLSFSLQLKGVDTQALQYIPYSSPIPPVAVVYVTVCPPLDL